MINGQISTSLQFNILDNCSPPGPCIVLPTRPDCPTGNCDIYLGRNALVVLKAIKALDQDGNVLLKSKKKLFSGTRTLKLSKLDRAQFENIQFFLVTYKVGNFPERTIMYPKSDIL